MDVGQLSFTSTMSPFDGENDIETLSRAREGVREPLAHLAIGAPEPLVRAIEALLAPSPADRPVHAGAFLDALNELSPSPLTRRDLGAFVRTVAAEEEARTEEALASLRTARSLTTEPSLQERIDSLIARLVGGDLPSATPIGVPAADRTPFQATVEQTFRAHEIMGRKIGGIEWTGPGAVRVSMIEFPMEAMPPMVREKFETRLRNTLNDAAEAHPVDGDRSVTIVDTATGRTMTTVTP